MSKNSAKWLPSIGPRDVRVSSLIRLGRNLQQQQPIALDRHVQERRAGGISSMAFSHIFALNSIEE